MESISGLGTTKDVCTISVLSCQKVKRQQPLSISESSVPQLIQNVGASTSPAATGKVATGDATATALLMALLMAAGGTVVFARKRIYDK